MDGLKTLPFKTRLNESFPNHCASGYLPGLIIGTIDENWRVAQPTIWVPHPSRVCLGGDFPPASQTRS